MNIFLVTLINRTLVVMPQHFMPVWWIAKDSLGIVALGIFSNITSLVKPRPKVQVRFSLYCSGSGSPGFKPGTWRCFLRH